MHESNINSFSQNFSDRDLSGLYINYTLNCFLFLRDIVNILSLKIVNKELQMFHAFITTIGSK